MLTNKRKLLGILLMLPANISLAGDVLPPQFTLSRFIPADFWFVANAVPNPKNQWLRDQWWRVADALAESGIEHDLVPMISMLSSWDGDLQHGVGSAHLFKSILSVPWGDLLSGEVVVAERMRRGTLQYEYIMLTKSTPDVAKKNMAVLINIFSSIAQTQQTIHLTHRQQQGIDQWMLRDNQSVYENAKSLRLTLFQKDEVVGLVLGASARKQVLSLLRGKPLVQSILQTPRFQEAMSQVEVPEDGYTFFDAQLLIDDLRKAVNARIGLKGKSTKGHPISSIARHTIKLFDIYDYIITSFRTDGKRQYIQSVTSLQRSKKHAPLARVIYDRRLIDNFDRYIPVDAVSFCYNSNVDMGRGYHLIRHFVSAHVPEGEGMLSKFDDLTEGVGLNVDRDILSWLSGETLHITLPAASPTPMSQYESVFFIRVKDPKVAFEKVNKALSFVANKLRDIGQPVFVRQVDAKNGKCCEVVHPLLVMLGRPAIGVVDNWLYVSSSQESVNRCVAVARSEAPSVRSNKRFQREGMIPTGPVRSISFTDRRYYGQELARQVTAINRLGSIVPTMLLKHEVHYNTEDVQQKLKKVELVTNLLATLGKLPAVLKEINFYSSTSSYSTFDGQYVHCDSLINYRDPTEDYSDKSTFVNVEIRREP